MRLNFAGPVGLNNINLTTFSVPNILNQYNIDIANENLIRKSNCIIRHYWLDESTNIKFPHALFSKQLIDKTIVNLNMELKKETSFLELLEEPNYKKEQDTIFVILKKQSFNLNKA